jgi:hypothetical protein
MPKKRNKAQWDSLHTPEKFEGVVSDIHPDDVMGYLQHDYLPQSRMRNWYPKWTDEEILSESWLHVAKAKKQKVAGRWKTKLYLVLRKSCWVSYWREHHGRYLRGSDGKKIYVPEHEILSKYVSDMPGDLRACLKR